MFQKGQNKEDRQVWFRWPERWILSTAESHQRLLYTQQRCVTDSSGCEGHNATRVVAVPFRVSLWQAGFHCCTFRTICLHLFSCAIVWKGGWEEGRDASVGKGAGSSVGRLSQSISRSHTVEGETNSCKWPSVSTWALWHINTCT